MLATRVRRESSRRGMFMYVLGSTASTVRTASPRYLLRAVHPEYSKYIHMYKYCTLPPYDDDDLKSGRAACGPPSLG